MPGVGTQLAVPAIHARADNPYSLVFVKDAQPGGEVGKQNGVAIQQQQKRAAGVPRRKVVASREAEVGPAFKNTHGGERGSHVVGRAVGRAVVDEDHLVRHADVPPDRVQAIVHVVL